MMATLRNVRTSSACEFWVTGSPLFVSGHKLVDFTYHTDAANGVLLAVKQLREAGLRARMRSSCTDYNLASGTSSVLANVVYLSSVSGLFTAVSFLLGRPSLYFL